MQWNSGISPIGRIGRFASQCSGGSTAACTPTVTTLPWRITAWISGDMCASVWDPTWNAPAEFFWSQSVLFADSPGPLAYLQFPVCIRLYCLFPTPGTDGCRRENDARPAPEPGRNRLARVVV